MGCALCGRKLTEPKLPRFIMRKLPIVDRPQRQQRLVHLVGVARRGPGFLAHGGNRVGVELAQVFRALRIDETTRRHGLGAALFQRRAVEERIRPRAQDFGRELRWRGQVARHDACFTVFEFLQQRDQTFQVHRIEQAVLQRLRDQRMIGNLAFAHDVFEAGDLVGKHRGQQVFRLHALDLRRHLGAAREARQRQCGAGVPAEAQREHRRVQQRLGQHVVHGIGVQVARDFVQRKTVAGRKRQHDRVFRRRRLQFEIEAAAETLAQCQAPRPIQSAAERRVDDQLHAAGFVEETFHRQRRLRRQQAEFGFRGGQVIDQLSCGGIVEADFVVKPGKCCSTPLSLRERGWG